MLMQDVLKKNFRGKANGRLLIQIIKIICITQ